ncbi:hypothetical protein ALC60_03101 [Trachymyrmex zeteki]|uniref:Uncharacterized protein n=1 Tax=Mycetomoellerius zeteki TaxID=64791 RepID=A0A151XCH8_9HYME|nr:hypothetical protein ALC60_03101 [Trachymyrmex zeteki]
MSGIYGVRLAQKSSRISREESACATGDVDERGSDRLGFLHPKKRRQEEEKEEEEKKEERRRREKERERNGGKRDKAVREEGERSIARLTGACILRLTFKIRNRWEAGKALMTLAGPGPRWRNGREVEVRGRRRAQTAVSTDAPDLPHAAL